MSTSVMHSYKAICYSIIALLCLAGCGSNGAQHDAQHGDTVAITKDTTAAKTGTNTTTSSTTADDEVTFIPKKISKDVFGSRPVLAGSRFSPLAALKQLFPGNYYSFVDSLIVEADSVRLEAWQCRELPKQYFPGWYGEGPDGFPYEDGNLTLYKDALHYTDDMGRQNVIVSFSTLAVQPPEFMYCGRTACAYMGLAWYRQEKDGWVLQAFNPVLGCFGAFQALPAIHLARLGKDNVGCYMAQTNGGPGGPFYTDLHYFGIVNGNFRQLLKVENVGRSGTGISDWDMKAQTTPGAAGFGNIQLWLHGNCAKESFEATGEDMTEVPVEIRDLAKKRDSFYFSIKRVYSFEKDTFRLLSTKIERPGK